MDEVLVALPNCIVCRQANPPMALPREGVERWRGGAHIQVAFPGLTADDRELLITGTHPACWETLAPDDDEEEMF